MYKGYIKNIGWFIIGCIYSEIMKYLMKDIPISNIFKYMIALIVLLIIGFTFIKLKRRVK